MESFAAESGPSLSKFLFWVKGWERGSNSMHFVAFTQICYFPQGLKPENAQQFVTDFYSDVFRWYSNGTLGYNGLLKLVKVLV